MNKIRGIEGEGWRVRMYDCWEKDDYGTRDYKSDNGCIET